MKRFLSMLALAVLVLQSVVTSAVYAVNEEGEGTVPEAAVETVASDPVSDESNNSDVVTDLTNSEVTTAEVEETTTPVVEEEIVSELMLNSVLGEFTRNLSSFESSDPTEISWDEFLERWNTESDCEGLGCVENAKQGRINDNDEDSKKPETDLNPGDIGMWKLVQEGDNPGEYQVSIGVRGEDIISETVGEKKVCAVVVFDKSKSMEDKCERKQGCKCGWFSCTYEYGEYMGVGNKWNNAVNGAVSFSNALRQANSQSYVGLVLFSTEAEEKVSLAPSALNSNNFGSPEGGTNLHAGLKAASNMLSTSTCEGANKYVVVISDGEPSFYVNGDFKHYGCGNSDKSCTNLKNGGNDNGYSLCSDSTICNEGEKPSDVAIHYADDELKSKGVEIFAIGYETDSTANGILTNIASEGEGHFYAGNTDEVVSAFNNIATTVNTAVAGSDAVITDGLGANFSLVGGQGQEGAVFVKNIGDISSGGVAYTFTIKINDDYLPSGIMFTNDINNIRLSYMVGSENKEVVLDNSAYINFTCEGLQHIEMVDGVYKCVSSTKKEDCKPVEIANGRSIVEKVDVTWNDEIKEWNVTPECTDFECNQNYVKDVDSKICKEDKNNNGTADEDERFTVIYKDGEEVLKTEPEKKIGDTLEAYTPTKTDYVFDEWTPTWKSIVAIEDANTDNEIVYTAKWKEDKNNNGIADEDEKFTVIYKDGGEVLKTETGLSLNAQLQEYVPEKEGYTFKSWDPTRVNTVKAENANENSEIIYNATYSEACNTGYHYENVENGETVEKICVNDEKKEGVECVKEGAPSNAHYNITTGAGTWSGTTQSYIGVKCSWDCDQGYIKDGNICRSSGGGGGGSSSSSYSCKNLPLHAIENNKDKPTKDTDYTYSQNTGAVCTFQCISGYTRNADKKQCVKSGGGNGGGDEVIELGGQVSDKCSVEGSNYSEEEKAAYLYACENDITTIRDIEDARLGDFLTRAEMAKMISVFATKELGMKPNTSKDCSNFANSIASYNQEMKDFMVMSCQLEIMGIHTTNYEAIPDFMPDKRVSRAEFGTVLSRILWGNKYEGTNSNYYVNHLNALKESNIITNINPHITEYRAWVFLMLYRSVEAIKLSKDVTNETVEEQVNEELQEEGKAQTGLVTEYDSGSVVPEMVTETASGTLATGTVAEAGAGSTVEPKTGDTVTTTGDIAKDEAKVETESTTGSAN